jgi:hypothetical protein
MSHFPAIVKFDNIDTQSIRVYHARFFGMFKADLSYMLLLRSLCFSLVIVIMTETT